MNLAPAGNDVNKFLEYRVRVRVRVARLQSSCNSLATKNNIDQERCLHATLLDETSNQSPKRESVRVQPCMRLSWGLRVARRMELHRDHVPGRIN